MNTSARLGTDSPAVVTTALTLAIGTAGGAVFALFGPPLPWLLGVLCFTAGASVTRIRLGLDLRLRAVAMLVLGTTIGSALSPELLGRVATWFISLTGRPLRRFAHKGTAAALPGWTLGQATARRRGALHLHPVDRNAIRANRSEIP